MKDRAKQELKKKKKRKEKNIKRKSEKHMIVRTNNYPGKIT